MALVQKMPSVARESLIVSRLPQVPMTPELAGVWINEQLHQVWSFELGVDSGEALLGQSFNNSRVSDFCKYLLVNKGLKFWRELRDFTNARAA